MNNIPIIKKRINHDSMWISCKFSSGGNFKYTILRYQKKLELAFSNDPHEGGEQLKIFNKWLKKSLTGTFGEQFNRLHALCLTCNTGKQLITLMKKDYDTRS